jgi:hypothetical protein
MNCIDQYHSRREKCWDEVERFFNNLTPHLYRQARLLRNNLASQFSDTGNFHDILSRATDYPPLNLPFWLLDDYGIPEGQAHSKLEKHLFSASFFIFATLYTQESILDDGSFFDNEYIFLANALSQEANRHFSRLFPVRSLFWEYYRKVWAEYAEASLSNWQELAESITVIEAGDLLRSKDLFAPYKLIPLGIILLAGRQEDLPKLLMLLDHLHSALRILQDSSTLPYDLAKGKYTYPLLKMMIELEIPLGKPYNPQGVLVAMALTGYFSKIAQECQGQVETCLVEAGALKLNTLSGYLKQLQARANEMEELLSLREPPIVKEEDQSPGATTQKPNPTPITDNLSKALDMAEGYLLSDLTFKESWEVHRRGLFGAAEVTARFPSGLILEILCSHGHDLAPQVDAFIQHLQDHRFSYYDHPQLPYADTDNLAALCRLFRYSNKGDSYRRALEIPLDWMRSSVREDGRIPVWIGKSTIMPGVDDRFVRLLGEGCGAIEASLLTGLIEYDWENNQEIIQKSATRLLDRFSHLGTGISINYPTGYCLWRINQLLGTLSIQPIQDELRSQIKQVTELYPEILLGEARQYRITPQTAAFLTLASLSSPASDLFNRRWITILLKSQRSDGSWYGEPLFFAPNRGEVTTWHSSHLLTSAYCYHALKSYSNLSPLP